jgi:hypothetical protein
MLWQTGGMRTLLLSALAYARLVGVARSRSWICACLSRGRVPGQVPGRVPAGGTLDMRGRIFSLPLHPPPRGEGGGLFNYLLRCCTHYVAQCIGSWRKRLKLLFWQWPRFVSFCTALRGANRLELTYKISQFVYFPLFSCVETSTDEKTREFFFIKSKTRPNRHLSFYSY